MSDEKVMTPPAASQDFIREIVAADVAAGKNGGKVVTQASKDKDYLVDNPNRRCPVIEKARKDLGFNPTIELDEGLRRSLIWYGGNREAEAS